MTSTTLKLRGRHSLRQPHILSRCLLVCEFHLPSFVVASEIWGRLLSEEVVRG